MTCSLKFKIIILDYFPLWNNFPCIGGKQNELCHWSECISWFLRIKINWDHIEFVSIQSNKDVTEIEWAEVKNREQMDFKSIHVLLFI